MPTLTHGTRAMIAAGCTCNLCALVRETRPRPRAGSVLAAPARDHLLVLVAAGWTYRRLAEVSGYRQQTLRGLAQGRTLFTSPLIAEDVLSIPVKERAA